MTNNKPAYYTPLRYPGGKGQLASFFKVLLSENRLMGAPYVELYAGGSGVALSLLLEHYVSCIHINDIDKSVFSFWFSILNHADDLCKLISKTPVTMTEWRKQKSVQAHSDLHSPLELGFSTFFLNRTNRSGIINAGVIGGKKQDGPWKMDARYNKADLIERIRLIEKYKSRIFLHNSDAAKFVIQKLPAISNKALIYLDPPYYVKGSELYENHYSHKDHEKIAHLVQSKVEQNWVVSYDNTPQIQKLYSGFPRINYGLNYSAQNRYSGKESMFFDDRLIIPKVSNPSIVKVRKATLDSSQQDLNRFKQRGTILFQEKQKNPR